MATNVIMPSLGFDMTEGKLANWLKKEGDHLEKGQAIAEIETEKATVEIEATVGGTLQKVLVPAGQTVPVGTIIAMIAEAGDQVASSGSPQPAVASAKPETMHSTAEMSLAPSAPATTEVPGVEQGTVPADMRIKASPLARKMAQAAGLDLASIKGSGPGGRIMERDIESATAARAAIPASAAPVAVSGAPSPAPQPPATTIAPAGATTPLNRMRQAIARRMAESKTTVPHFYVTVEINMAEALKVREQLNALAPDTDKISVNDLVIAAAARTLVQFPNFNASYRDGALEFHPQINIGIAVALEDGLITPVLREADKKSLKTIAGESKLLSERARTNKLRADDLGGSTFTVSNLGMFGVDEFSAIINPPEAAILAVGAAVKRPIVVDGGEIQVAPIMKATLSVDHRVADGAQAGRFLQALRKLLENPVNLLLNS